MGEQAIPDEVRTAQYEEGVLRRLQALEGQLEGLSAIRSFHTPEEARKFMDDLVALRDEVSKDMPMLEQAGTPWAEALERVLHKVHEIIPSTIEHRFPLFRKRK